MPRFGQTANCLEKCRNITDTNAFESSHRILGERVTFISQHLALLTLAFFHQIEANQCSPSLSLQELYLCTYLRNLDAAIKKMLPKESLLRRKLFVANLNCVRFGQNSRYPNLIVRYVKLMADRSYLAFIVL